MRVTLNKINSTILSLARTRAVPSTRKQPIPYRSATTTTTRVVHFISRDDPLYSFFFLQRVLRLVARALYRYCYYYYYYYLRRRVRALFRPPPTAVFSLRFTTVSPRALSCTCPLVRSENRGSSYLPERCQLFYATRMEQ